LRFIWWVFDLAITRFANQPFAVQGFDLVCGTFNSVSLNLTGMGQVGQQLGNPGPSSDSATWLYLTPSV